VAPSGELPAPHGAPLRELGLTIVVHNEAAPRSDPCEIDALCAATDPPWSHSPGHGHLAYGGDDPVDASAPPCAYQVCCTLKTSIPRCWRPYALKSWTSSSIATAASSVRLGRLRQGRGRAQGADRGRLRWLGGSRARHQQRRPQRECTAKAASLIRRRHRNVGTPGVTRAALAQNPYERAGERSRPANSAREPDHNQSHRRGSADPYRNDGSWDRGAHRRQPARSLAPTFSHPASAGSESLVGFLVRWP